MVAMLRSSRALLLGGFGLVATLASTRTAYASPNTTYSTEVALAGEHVYDTLSITNGGVLRVIPYDGSPGSGTLHIKANRITIEQGGVISATGSGYAGKNNDNGDAEPGSNGGGRRPATLGHPGSGGGYGGKGASGASDACTGFADAPGGAAFYMSGAPLVMGSAGGAANALGAATTAGGRGGGLIVLEAASIILNGRVEADGAPSYAFAGVAAGAGSGGGIHLIANSLSGSGELSVAGGNGAHGDGNAAASPAIPPNNGGGGGGGVLVITATSVTGTIQRVALAGTRGTCMTSNAADGTIVDETPTLSCVDVDQDGHFSAICGGDDCDDSDPLIYPQTGLQDDCDGHDNDCDNIVDEDATCAPGSSCDSTAGMCVAQPDAGAGGGAGVEPRPDHVEFEGGCAMARPGAGRLLSALALALAALGASARRRSRRS